MISTKEMQKLEQNSNIPLIQLMENAGKQAAKIIKSKYDIKHKKILIACYHGNNGGDGFVIAHYLKDISKISIMFIGKEAKLSNIAKQNFNRAKQDNISFITDPSFDDYDIIIDAILGTGTKGDLLPPISETIKQINKSSHFIISIDIPTGINPDNGQKSNIYINPNLIITFHDIKTGLKKYINKTIIASIGIN